MLSLMHLPSHAQSKESGTIEGKVLNDGTPVPGVAVVISSPRLIGGPKTTVTNENGKYRFVALLPGLYEVKAQLEGFKTSIKTGIKVSVNTTATVDLNLEIGTIQQQITVEGVPPLVDVKDSQTAVTNITNDLIQNLPSTQFVTQIVNLAPGINNDSAFGGLDTGVQYQIDGVDVSDPELGSAYVFLDYGVVEESQIMGVGAPAEYDGFTGIAFNVVTKSGGNSFKGMFDSFLQLEGWNDKNSDDPDLTSAKNAYYNAHFSLGGPIIKDKMWFFGAVQYYRSERTPSGFDGAITYNQPRLFGKITWQMGKNDRFSAFVERDWYQGKNRGASSLTSPEAVRDQDSPELAFNANYVHIFSDYTFLEAKFAGFTSYYKLQPAQGYDIPGHVDIETYERTVNWTSYYHAFRDRYQLNAHINHHADDFIKGSHDFKFGVEVAYNPTKTEWGYAGGVAYWDYAGEPYAAYYTEGYAFRAQNLRVSAFIQDSWSVSDRLKINPGVRINYYRGKIVDVGTVFKPNIAIAPRIGVTFDVFGDHTTAIKAHYGKYFEGAITAYYTSLAPQTDYIGTYWDGTQYVEEWRDVWANAYTMDDDINMPYMHQYTVSIERELMKNLSVSLSFIHRTNHNFIDRVNYTGAFEQQSYTDPHRGGTYTVYNQTTARSDNKYLITNPEKGAYPIIMIDPSRKYTGISFVVNKRFSNKWGVLASYTYGKAEGNNDNYAWGSRTSGLGYSNLFVDPNYQTNSFGLLTNDYTHMIKIQGVMVLPLNINFAAYFSYISGSPYNRYVRVYGLNQGSVNILGDELGSYRYPAQVNLDLRLEKVFRLSNTFRVGLMADVFNVFNDDVTTWVQEQAGDSFDEVLGIISPRVFRLGLRFYIN